jgi:DNA topoisomerase-2
MVLLDENGIPTHYDSAAAIAEAFFLLRLPVYEARKRYCLEQLDREIVELGQRVRFIRAVISKEIKILRRPKAEILAAMARLQLPAELLNKTRLSNCTEDEVQELLAKAAAKEAERNQLAATPSAAIWEQELEELEREYRTQYQEEMMTLALPAPASVPPPSAVSSGPVLTLI